MKSDEQESVCNHCSNCVIFFIQPAKADIRTFAHCAWLLHPSHSLVGELFLSKYHKTNHMKGPTIHTGRFYKTFHTIVKTKANTLTCTNGNSHLSTFGNQLSNVTSVSTAMLYMTWWEGGRREDTSIRSCSLTKEMPVEMCALYSLTFLLLFRGFLLTLSMTISEKHSSAHCCRFHQAVQWQPKLKYHYKISTPT